MGKEKKIFGITKECLLSSDMISFFAFIAIAILLLVPVAISIYAVFVRSIDRIQSKHLIVLEMIIIPLICVIAFALYILNLLRMKRDNISLKKIICKNPLIVVFSLAVILMIISQVYNGIGYALKGYFIMTIGETYDLQVGYFIFILFIATQVKKESHKRYLLRIHMLVSLVVMITAFIIWKSRFGNDEVYYIENVGFASIFWNINYYGYYLAATVPLAGAAFISEKKKMWKIVSCLVFMANTVALSLNDSMGAWIGAFFAMFFVLIAYSIIGKKINLQAILLIVVFAICLYIPGRIKGNFEVNTSGLFEDIGSIVGDEENAGNAGSGRWRIWKAAVTIINDNKWFGIGFEGVAYKGYKGLGVRTYSDRPHNEFLQYALFYGIPMMIMYFAGCLGVFIRALKKRKVMDGATLVCLSASFGYLVSSFFGLTVFSTALYLFIFLGMGYVRNEECVTGDGSV